MAQAGVDAVTADQRRLMHLLYLPYLELSGFRSAYLAHQQVEERVVIPAIEQAVGPEGALGLHTAIVSSIAPEEMARSLAFMLPAMNLDDRTEMLTGMKMIAPKEAFEAVTGLAKIGSGAARLHGTRGTSVNPVRVAPITAFAVMSAT